MAPAPPVTSIVLAALAAAGGLGGLGSVCLWSSQRVDDNIVVGSSTEVDVSQDASSAAFAETAEEVVEQADFPRETMSAPLAETAVAKEADVPQETMSAVAKEVAEQVCWGAADCWAGAAAGSALLDIVADLRRRGSPAACGLVAALLCDLLLVAGVALWCRRRIPVNAAPLGEPKEAVTSAEAEQAEEALQVEEVEQVVQGQEETATESSVGSTAGSAEAPPANEAEGYDSTADCSSADVAEERVTVGSIVKVVLGFDSNNKPSRMLHIGERGEVKKIDEDGDARIAFGSGTVWVLRRNFSNLRVEEPPTKEAEVECSIAAAAEVECSIAAAAEAAQADADNWASPYFLKSINEEPGSPVAGGSPLKTARGPTPRSFEAACRGEK